MNPPLNDYEIVRARRLMARGASLADAAFALGALKSELDLALWRRVGVKTADLKSGPSA